MTQEQAEDCPLTIIRDQMRGIHEDIADLMAYAQGQIDEQKKKEVKNDPL